MPTLFTVISSNLYVIIGSSEDMVAKGCDADSNPLKEATGM